ncbi:hypothetical protein GE300_08060 [Rhodobacteraceae bacterium 2CG4]|uniref:Sulfotransferase family protein n=1 Tax=Halovulum marinum TaxID=2662447 RepID=A0A6L5YZY0_9RHOB|nr:hypothetical protein [Halovulum marinum]MSU89569.1 hypothetical protein [Halovulum marinum]
MLEYRRFCYLDVEKTGSTFVRAFLARHAGAAPVGDAKHRPPKYAHRWRKYYFASARDPFDQYLSLYTFGCEGKGVFRNHLDRIGAPLTGSYDGTQAGFEHWLDVLCGDGRLTVLPPSMAGLHSPHLGIMGLRFLRLTLPRARSRLPRFRSARAIAGAYRRGGLPRAVLRQETLNADLAVLVDGPLRRHLRFPDAALAELDAPERLNASDRSGAICWSRVSPDLRARVAALEWFHRDVLGYPAR